LVAPRRPPLVLQKNISNWLKTALTQGTYGEHFHSLTCAPQFKKKNTGHKDDNKSILVTHIPNANKF
jgi:hypothetical protein